MKKILSMVMAVVMLTGTFVVSAYAEETDQQYLFRDKFVEKYGDWDELSDSPIVYDEVYYHYSDNHQIDWVLVHEYIHNEPMTVYGVFGNRVIFDESFNYPFYIGYAVYDVESSEFIDFVKAWNSEKYDGLQEALNTCNIGKLIGDMNNDNEITVADATMIQKCVAGIEQYSYKDEIVNYYSYTATEKLRYISDFNRDGVRNIDDATAIQKYLAEQ